MNVIFDQSEENNPVVSLVRSWFFAHGAGEIIHLLSVHLGGVIGGRIGTLT